MHEPLFGGGSRGQFDHRKPLGRFRSSPFRTSRRAATGFWHGCQTAQQRQQLRKGSAHARRRQLLHWERRLPGQARLDDQGTRQAQLDIHENHSPGPAIGCLWGTELRGRPLEHLFAEALRVLAGEPGDIHPPDGCQIRRIRPPPPQPEGHGNFGRFGEALHLQADEGPADKRTRLARSLLLVVLWNRVQPAPALDLHPTILRIRRPPLSRRTGPGSRVVTDELGPMPPRTPAGWPLRWVC
jgi:hypothetical protein